MSPIEIWKMIFDGKCSWVCFKNGTCVTVDNFDSNVLEEAKNILDSNGSVHAGTASGDFTVNTLENGQGWIVTYSCPNIYSFVSKADMEEGVVDFIVGVVGRTNRQKDAESKIAVFESKFSKST
ncbi:hypothetical protein [Microbulbifer pacificus]|uniref:Profilin n=1 Tax=Microbulbifer pacificus TaxID=407164 RepID=A0AAU0N4E7_9GAMM|nr:hypothetical protein [Microbulbifer pacificus]WOX07235.1 hypothetical protein R5R33_08895 [Microbulbifer pacificus]